MDRLLNGGISTVTCNNKYKIVPVEVEIRENATLVVVNHSDELQHHQGEELPSVFNWEEGNYSCDCNRFLFFSRAMSIEEPDDYPCSDGKFSVRICLKDTNEIIYDEFEKQV